MAGQDRIIALREQATRFTGIDFVQVEDPCEQESLRVYFHTDPTLLTTSFDDLPFASRDVRIVSTVPGVADVRVQDFQAPKLRKDTVGRWYLAITVEQPGDFVPYRLFLDDPITRQTPPLPSRIDRVFNGVTFSFKAGCPKNVDCADVPEECCPEPQEDVRIDYLARDFVSLRNALLDFLSQRYPDWSLPIESDVGVMFIELLAHLGDEFSYMQDRVAREAYLETLTQRRSLRRLARLVDYELHDGRSASTTLELTAQGDVTVNVGARAWAVSDFQEPVAFEVVASADGTSSYPVREVWNAVKIKPYAWDEGQTCLERGATYLDVSGEITDAQSLSGRPLLLKLDPPDAGSDAKRLLLNVARVEVLRDELFNQSVTRLYFDDGQALSCAWSFAGLSATPNVVPARAGETRVAYVRCGDARADDPTFLLSAVERAGARYTPAEREPFDLAPCITQPSADERATIFLFSLPGSEESGLGFVGDELRDSVPEVSVWRIDSVPTKLSDPPLLGAPFHYARTLLTAAPEDRVFTLEDGTFRRIVGYYRDGEEIVHRDYASGLGYTLRFGDDTFGLAPARDDLFYVEYRLGTGTRANLSAGTIRGLSARDSVSNMPAGIVAVDNPFAVCNGVDPESASDAKLFAPEAFKDKRFFALKPQDYGDQLVDNLGWVQRAQGAFRWTGSWHTALCTVDPENAVAIRDDERLEAERLLDCVRQAGRDTTLRAPKYVDLDIQITVCLEPWAYAGEVRPKLMDKLVGRGNKPGFFNPDFFTFGTPLRRSALEATIHDVEGVRAVHGVQIRQRGFRSFKRLTALTFQVPSDSVIRVDHDPAHPERGSLELVFEGGA